MSTDREAVADDGAPLATPRWVKAFGVVIIILILAFIVLRLTGNGFGNHRSG